MDEGVWFKNAILDKMTAMRTLTFLRFLLNRGCACAYRGRLSATRAFDKFI